jgi:DNA-directed RNA polymerase specialized sigma24 family protein
MSLGQKLAPHLPFLRRYARALTGSQSHGDNYVRATLEAIVAAPDDFPGDVDARLGLYKIFQAIWTSTNFDDDVAAPPLGAEPEAIAQARLASITPLSRQALLLTAMEGFTPEDTAYLIDSSSEEVEALVAEAIAEIDRQTRTEVLIIEDEPIIAMDLETIVRDLGHASPASPSPATRRSRWRMERPASCSPTSSSPTTARGSTRSRTSSPNSACR